MLQYFMHVFTGPCFEQHFSKATRATAPRDSALLLKQADWLSYAAMEDSFWIRSKTTRQHRSPPGSQEDQEVYIALQLNSFPG